MLKIRIKTEGLTEKEKNKVEMARLQISRAVNSIEFEDFVKSFSWERRVSYGYFWSRRSYVKKLRSFSSTGKSNEAIFNKIMSGYETLKPDCDYEANIYMKIDRKNVKRVLGYTYASTRFQWVYSYFFKNGSVKDVAGNIWHEYCHKQGYKHDKKYTTRRPYSVPYACGYFVRDFTS